MLDDFCHNSFEFTSSNNKLIDLFAFEVGWNDAIPHLQSIRANFEQMFIYLLLFSFSYCSFIYIQCPYLKKYCFIWTPNIVLFEKVIALFETPPDIAFYIWKSTFVKEMETIFQPTETIVTQCYSQGTTLLVVHGSC